MNIHKYLSDLYRALWADPTIDSDEMSGSIFIARPNDFTIWCSPGWSIYISPSEVENTDLINIEFILSDADGNDYEDHDVPFPLTFDIEADVKRYKELVAEWLPIIYPYI